MVLEVSPVVCYFTFGHFRIFEKKYVKSILKNTFQFLVQFLSMHHVKQTFCSSLYLNICTERKLHLRSF